MVTMSVTWPTANKANGEAVLEKLLDEQIRNLPESFAKEHFWTF